MDPRKNQRGFTLLEIIFAMAIGLVVMGAVYMAMITGQRSSVGIEQRVAAAQDVRASLELMSIELGMASFNPNFVPGIWVEIGGCANPSANQGFRGIQAATANAITVQMDINENNAVGPPDPNEVIAYVYDIANRRITRATNCGGNQPFLGEIAGTAGRSVRVVNTDLNLPVFRYFNGQGVEIPAASLPGAIPDIRRIEIAIAVETENVDPATQQRQRMVYTNGVILRNHAFTL